jgi:DNA-binding protein HU-beta
LSDRVAQIAQFLAVFARFLADRRFLLDKVRDQLEAHRARPPPEKAAEDPRNPESKGDPMAKVMTKSQVIQAVADAHKQKLARKDVANVLASLATVGHKELKKNGMFVLPGFAKFVVIKKAATKARPGINPFTKEAITIKAKPARKVLKARPVKAAKDAVA